MSNADELIKLRKLLDNGTINKEEFFVEKEKITGVKSVNQISSDTGNLIPPHFQDISKKLRWKEVVNTNNFIYYQEVSRLKLLDGEVRYFFKYDKNLLDEDRVPEKYYKKFQNKEKKNVIYNDDLYSGEVSLGIDIISEISLSPNKDKVKLEREKWSYKSGITKFGNFSITIPSSFLAEVLDIVTGIPWTMNSINGIRNINVQFDYLNNDYFEKLFKFRSDLIKAIRNEVPSCPACGESKFVMSSACSTCQWRFKYIK